MSYRKVVRVGDVAEGRLTVGRHGIRRVVVTRARGELRAFSDVCPHAGAPLGGGHVQAGHVVCPRHGWRFRLNDGACPEHPIYDLRMFAVREQDGWVEVDVPEEELL